VRGTGETIKLARQKQLLRSTARLKLVTGGAKDVPQKSLKKFDDYKNSTTI
jgi:hypothetical protein